MTESFVLPVKKASRQYFLFHVLEVYRCSDIYMNFAGGLRNDYQRQPSDGYSGVLF